MSVTSSVTIQTSFSGDVTENLINSVLANASSPGKTDIVTLAAGNNTITAPLVTGIVVTGLLIIPPAGNLNQITLKGVNADTGIPIHLSNPTFITLATSFVNLVLNAASQINGVRLVWS